MRIYWIRRNTAITYFDKSLIDEDVVNITTEEGFIFRELFKALTVKHDEG